MRTRIIGGRADGVNFAYPGRYITPWLEGIISDADFTPTTYPFEDCWRMKDFARAVWRVAAWQVDFNATIQLQSGFRFPASASLSLVDHYTKTGAPDAPTELRRIGGFYFDDIFVTEPESGNQITCFCTIFKNSFPVGQNIGVGGHIFSRFDFPQVGIRNGFIPRVEFAYQFDLDTGTPPITGFLIRACSTSFMQSSPSALDAGRATIETPKGITYEARLLYTHGGGIFDGSSARGTLTIRPSIYLTYEDSDGNPKFLSETGELSPEWNGADTPSSDADGVQIMLSHQTVAADGNYVNFIG